MHSCQCFYGPRTKRSSCGSADIQILVSRIVHSTLSAINSEGSGHLQELRSERGITGECRLRCRGRCALQSQHRQGLKTNTSCMLPSHCRLAVAYAASMLNSQQIHDIPRASSFVKQKHGIQFSTTMLTTCYERQAESYVQKTPRNIRPPVQGPQLC